MMAVFAHHTSEHDERMSLKALELGQSQQPGSGGRDAVDMLDNE